MTASLAQPHIIHTARRSRRALGWLLDPLSNLPNLWHRGSAWLIGPLLIGLVAVGLAKGADYANQLGDYSGQEYKVDPNVELRNGDQIVKTTLGSTEIDYLVRGSHILDIYANGTVSELATRRAEFSSILAASGGASGLTQELRQRTQQLLGG